MENIKRKKIPWNWFISFDEFFGLDIFKFFGGHYVLKCVTSYVLHTICFSFMKWLPSACMLVEKSLQQQNYSNNDQREAVLTIGLLRSLLQRLSDVQEWYGVIHRRSLLHVILSHTHHSLRSIVNPEVIQASLSLCLALSKTQQGCHGLLAMDMGQLIWLPLSSFNR